MVIGHNVILDLLHVCKTFGFDLPTKYDTFIEQLSNFLPNILDTKYFATFKFFHVCFNFLSNHVYNCML
jgi:hypothetical protein